MNQRLTAIRRIKNDLKEYNKNPIPGISVFRPREDQKLLLHGNIHIQSGLYKDITIHIIIKVPDDYPMKAPSLYVADGQEFDYRFHNHVHGNSICTDISSNFYFDEKKGTGWSPGYTLTTILLQLTIFFSSSWGAQPSKQLIQYLKDTLNGFKCEECVHLGDVQEVKLNEADARLEYLRNMLTCSLMKSNLIDDDITLGYPLLLKRDKYKRVHTDPLLELMSYDAYVTQIQVYGGFNDNTDMDRVRFRSGLGNSYNYWLPCYFNENHFRYNLQVITNGLSVINYGIIGTEDSDFNKVVPLNVLPNILNKLVVLLMKGEKFLSESAICVYCQFMRLFEAFRDEYIIINHRMEETIAKFKKASKFRSKKYVPDLGIFILYMYLSKKHSIHSIWPLLKEELNARRVYWVAEDHTIIENLDFKRFFEASIVSFRVTMFNKMVAEKIAKRIKDFDKNYGFADSEYIQEIIKEINYINSIDTYSDYTEYMEFEEESEEIKKSIIIKSARISEEQGYTATWIYDMVKDKKINKNKNKVNKNKNKDIHQIINDKLKEKENLINLNQLNDNIVKKVDLKDSKNKSSSSQIRMAPWSKKN